MNLIGWGGIKFIETARQEKNVLVKNPFIYHVLSCLVGVFILFNAERGRWTWVSWVNVKPVFNSWVQEKQSLKADSLKAPKTVSWHITKYNQWQLMSVSITLLEPQCSHLTWASWRLKPPATRLMSNKTSELRITLCDGNQPLIGTSPIRANYMKSFSISWRRHVVYDKGAFSQWDIEDHDFSVWYNFGCQNCIFFTRQSSATSINGYQISPAVCEMAPTPLTIFRSNSEFDWTL